MSGRVRISSGSPYEASVGYSRAVKTGGWVFVSGTTSLLPDGSVHGPGDAREQTREILRRLAGVLEQAGSSLDEVVRYRVYLTSLMALPEVGEELGKVFGEIRPTNTLVQVAGLVHPALVVEIEADALIGSAYVTAEGDGV